ncbi:MAG: sigma-70 family RNA polymerase sigma factor [Planctomycetota bacterium]
MKHHPVEPDDSELIQSTLDGRQEAFGRLVFRYQNRLYNSMVQILRNEAEAEDTVQEAFIAALTKLSTFHGKSGFYTWLYRIAFNNAISRLRKRKKNTLSLDRETEDMNWQLPSSGPLPDSDLLQKERADQVVVALGRLSEEHRNILILREMDEMDYSAISGVLNLPVGTVRSRIHRARMQLKEIIEAMWSDE